MSVGMVDGLRDSGLALDAQREKGYVFREVVASIEQQRVGKELGRGGQFLVNRLVGRDGVVVKRLRAGRKMELQGQLSTSDYFDQLRFQHEVVAKYFGDQFVPRTEFLEVETNFGDPNPEYFEVLPGHEYVMVQEEIKGVDVGPFLMRGVEVPEASSALKKNLLGFIDRYNVMMRTEKSVLENQIRVDFVSGEVKVCDTNHYSTYEEYVDQNPFLQALGIDSKQVQTAQDILGLLADRVPELRIIKGLPYSTAIELLDFRDEVWGLACDGIAGRYPDNNSMLSGFKMLVKAAEYFPPEGENNVFVKKLIKTFKLDTT